MLVIGLGAPLGPVEEPAGDRDALLLRVLGAPGRRAGWSTRCRRHPWTARPAPPSTIAVGLVWSSRTDPDELVPVHAALGVLQRDPRVEPGRGLAELRRARPVSEVIMAMRDRRLRGGAAPAVPDSAPPGSSSRRGRRAISSPASPRRARSRLERLRMVVAPPRDHRSTPLVRAQGTTRPWRGIQVSRPRSAVRTLRPAATHPPSAPAR